MKMSEWIPTSKSLPEDLQKVIWVVIMIKKTIQDQPPNFRKEMQLYLLRCFKCVPEYGRENWGPHVASGKCAWCGWEDNENE